MIEILILLAACALAFSNGANDNFKGFATVWGSDTLHYRQALILATLATLAGSLSSLWLADALLQNFSGKGLVADAVASTPLFILAVATAAATTVFLATRLGLPVSTTHALIGGMIGAALAQQGSAVHFDKLAQVFLLPLLLSPVLALVLGMISCRWLRLHPVENDCACLMATSHEVMSASDGCVTERRLATPALVVAPAAACETLAAPVRISVSRSMDRLHVLSAMAICFARGVNDTPKLAALMLASQLMHAQISIALIGVVMAGGGLLFAQRVARTMSQRITRMDHTQGFTANLITASLVLFASKLGLPVSTTHVSVGAIAGVGASAKTLNWPALRTVLLSWLATLPLAAGLSWLVGTLV